MESAKTLTAEDAEKLLNELLNRRGYQHGSPKAIRNHTIALLMLDAGLRVGEVVQMRTFDLYFNTEPVTSITIRAAIAKNNRERTIPVSLRLSEALKMHYPNIECVFVKPETSYVFHCRDGRFPLTTRQVERIIRSAAMKSLGRPIHPHVLRHTFASRLMRKTNIRVVQELLGHKHLTSTQVYTHPNSDDLTKAINSIENGAATLTGQTPSGISTPGVSNGLNAASTNRDV